MCKVYKFQTSVKTGLFFIGDGSAVDFAGLITLCIGSKSDCSCFCFIFTRFSMREIQERTDCSYSLSVKKEWKF